MDVYPVDSLTETLTKNLLERSFHLTVHKISDETIGYEITTYGPGSIYLRIQREELLLKYIEIDWFEIDEYIRGKGYGIVILEAVEQTAKDLNMEGLSAYAFGYLVPFYRRMGWSGDQEDDEGEEGGGMAHMTKIL